jgi:aminoglycoside 2''-phosphotransferase
VTATLTPAQAARAITAHDPAWVVDAIEALGEGDFCSAYLVNHAWVFRFAKHAAAEASLRREWCLLPRIANQFEIRIPSPQVLGMDTPPQFVAHPMLPGPTLTKERYLQLGEAARERCAQQVGRFLVQMHATDPLLARQCGVRVTDYAACHRALWDRARHRLLAKLADRERHFVERTISRSVESDDPTAFTPTVLHGDLGPDHVLYDENLGSVSGVIDFGDVALGDPAWDLVYIYEDYGLDFLGRLLRAYRPTNPDALVKRVHRLFLLDAIEWVVQCAERASAELGEAIAHLVHLRTTGPQQLRALRAACRVAPADVTSRTR